MSLIHNEQTKLSATYLNGVAIAVLAVGGVAPMISMATGSATPAFGQTAVILGCLAASATLHLLARRLLRSLRP